MKENMCGLVCYRDVFVVVLIRFGVKMINYLFVLYWYVEVHFLGVPKIHQVLSGCTRKCT